MNCFFRFLSFAQCMVQLPLPSHPNRRSLALYRTRIGMLACTRHAGPT